MIELTCRSKECHYWYSLNIGFTFQPNVCNRCHDLLMMSMNLCNIYILSIKGADYRGIISGISKTETIDLIQNIDLSGKKRKKLQKNKKKILKLNIRNNF